MLPGSGLAEVHLDQRSQNSGVEPSHCTIVNTLIQLHINITHPQNIVTPATV